MDSARAQTFLNYRCLPKLPDTSMLSVEEIIQRLIECPIGALQIRLRLCILRVTVQVHLVATRAEHRRRDKFGDCRNEISCKGGGGV
jgi:hypothetical protein